MDDLIGEFIAETSESLAMLDQELVKLEYNPNDQVILGNIFNLVHTIKGTCGFLGLQRLETVAHATEDVIGKIRDGKINVTHDIIEIILGVLERIRGLIQSLEANGHEEPGEDSDLLHFLNLVSNPGGKRPMPATPPAAPVVQAAPAPIAPPAPPPEPVAVYAPPPVKMEAPAPIAPLPAPAVSIPAAAKPPIPKPAPLPVASEPAATKTELSEQLKERAVKQGLKTEAKDNAASGSHQMRVNPDVMENLMEMVSELVQTRNQLVQLARGRKEDELSTPLKQLSRMVSDLQHGMMKTRRQPLGNAWSKLPRMVRDFGNELGKKIDLHMEGEDTELDRQVLERIKDPLTYIVRYCCDHGLENPADRRNAGKAESGAVSLKAYYDVSHVIIDIKDDGRGLSCEQIKKRMLKKNMATPEELAELADEQVLAHMFATDSADGEGKAGTGDSLQAVKACIEKIGGTIRFASTLGKGFAFQMKIPVTLAIMPVVLVESAGQKFAIPQMCIRELVRVGAESDYKVETISNASMLRLRGELLPLMYLSDILSLPRTGNDSEYTVVLHTGSGEVGLVIDRVLDTEEIVVKPVSRVLSGIDIYAGTTILGDGSAIMILDTVGLSKHFGAPGMRKTSSANPVQDRNSSFLIVAAGEGAPKAVPLELVSRVETVQASEVEQTDAGPVVQYRGELMHLHTLPGCSIPTTGEFEVIVFAYDKTACGIVVDRILDVAVTPISISFSTKEEQYIGSAVMNGKTMDIVNINHFLTSANAYANSSRGLRLLVVEDNVFFMKLLVSCLKQSGFDVIEATSADQALTLLTTAPKLDAIITDIEMPGKDGFEFAAALRANIRLRNTPIIAISSSVNEQSQQRATNAGMNALMHKTNRFALIDCILAHTSSMTEGV